MKAHYCWLTLIRSLDHEEAGGDDLFAIDRLTVMQLLAQAWEEVTPVTIAVCWRHTGILPNLQPIVAVKAIPEVKAAVKAASKVLMDLNTVIHQWTGKQQNLVKPALVDDIKELLAEPEEPEWLEDDEDTLIAAVSGVCWVQELTEMDCA